MLWSLDTLQPEADYLCCNFNGTQKKAIVTMLRSECKIHLQRNIKLINNEAISQYQRHNTNSIFYLKGHKICCDIYVNQRVMSFISSVLSTQQHLYPRFYCDSLMPTASITFHKNYLN